MQILDSSSKPNSLVLVDVEGDEGEHAGVDEEHHKDGAEEPNELALPTPEQARAEKDINVTHIYVKCYCNILTINYLK